MRNNYKMCLVIPFCVISFMSFSQGAFAQNTDALRSDIYSGLKCCECREPFATCVCPEAKEMKVYIDALLENGIGKKEVLYKVAKKFSPDTILDAQTKVEVELRLIDEAARK